MRKSTTAVLLACVGVLLGSGFVLADYPTRPSKVAWDKSGLLSGNTASLATVAKNYVPTVGAKSVMVRWELTIDDTVSQTQDMALVYMAEFSLASTTVTQRGTTTLVTFCNGGSAHGGSIVVAGNGTSIDIRVDIALSHSSNYRGYYQIIEL